MRTEDLFKFGITPTTGKQIGKRFRVETIKEGCVYASPWDSEEGPVPTVFKDGAYEIWKEPKTLFDNREMRPTWGNLKKAMEAAGLDDETEFAVAQTGFLKDYCQSAIFKVMSLRKPYEKAKKYVVIE